MGLRKMEDLWHLETLQGAELHHLTSAVRENRVKVRAKVKGQTRSENALLLGHSAELNLVTAFYL